MDQYKYCNNCNEVKKNIEFYKNASYCKLCSNVKVIKYFKKKQNIILDCECGKQIKFFCINSHRKTKSHQKNLKIKEFIENINNMSINDESEKKNENTNKE